MASNDLFFKVEGQVNHHGSIEQILNYSKYIISIPKDVTPTSKRECSIAMQYPISPLGHSPVDPYFPGSEGRIDFYRNKFQIRYNDLYTLDMSNLHWERVHGGIAKVHGDARDKVPKPTEAHRFSSHKSFIRLSRSTAVLYGTGRAVQYSLPGNLHDDCFLLDLERAKSGVKPTSMWTRIVNGRVI